MVAQQHLRTMKTSLSLLCLHFMHKYRRSINIQFSAYQTFWLFAPEQTFLVLCGNHPKWSEGRTNVPNRPSCFRTNKDGRSFELRQTLGDIYLINNPIHLPLLHTPLEGLCCFNHGLGQFL